MSAIKEPHFFGTDLVSTKHIRNKQEYLSLFRPKQGEQIVGEASVYYLYSSRAAEEIKKFNASCKIIIMLRDPVDMVYSLHSQAVSSGNETIVDFADALAAEDDRRQGRRIPDIADFPQGLFYRDIARYSRQVKRFLDHFASHQVKIILFDDFASCPGKVFEETLHFLGVRDTDFQVAFERANPNRRLRFVALEHILKRRTGLRNVIKQAMPGLYSSLYAAFHRFNAVKAVRAVMDPCLEARLREDFTEDVKALSQIIDRDLTAWS